jgi:DNA-binding beta-propeller fold protein YncE
MRKIIPGVILLTVLFSCTKHDDEKKVTTSQYKPAVKLYFSEYSEYHIGYMYIDTLDKYFTLLNYDSGLQSPEGIAYNQAGKRLYIAEGDGSRVLRDTPDDPALKVVYDSDQGVSNPTAVAVDTVGKKLYWANSGSGQIMVGDLFGTAIDPTPLFGGAEVIDLCYGIAIDHKNNKIYFGDNNLHQISVGNLDGTGTPKVLYQSPAEMTLCPQSIVLLEDTLYWADDCSDQIASASADGKSTVKILFDNETDGVSQPKGVAIDKAKNKIYWSEYDHSYIVRGNLYGTGESELVLEGVQANSISLQYK